MRSPVSRIADLEARLTPKGMGKVYAVIGGPVGGNPVDFIRSCGIPLDEDRDMVIHHVPVAPSPSGPVPVARPWAWVGNKPAGATA